MLVPEGRRADFRTSVPGETSPSVGDEVSCGGVGGMFCSVLGTMRFGGIGGLGPLLGSYITNQSGRQAGTQ